VIDEETGDELALENHRVMSPRDLCTVEYLDRLAGAGVSIFKIEGRGRPADYVSTVTGVYKEALRSLAAGSYTEDRKAEWIERLKAVYNRGFWSGGFYCGERMERWGVTGDSQTTMTRVQVGVVSNYYARPGVAEFKLFQSELPAGSELLFEGATTGAIHAMADQLRVNGQLAERAVKDDIVTVAVPEKVRRGDKVFVLTNTD
jgi:putative protease